MFESDRAGSRVDLALQAVAAGWEELAAIDPAALSGADLLNLLDRLETDTRRRAAVTYGLIAELDARGTAGELGYPSAAVLIAERLRIGRRDAAGRVRLSADVAPRQALSGQRLQPRFPQVAAALADGEISPRHAAVICVSVDRLPDRVLADQPELAAQADPARARPRAGPRAVGGAGPQAGRLPGPGRRARDRPGPRPAPRRHAGDPARRHRPADRNPDQRGGRNVDDRAHHARPTGTGRGRPNPTVAPPASADTTR
jgi:hypothetical protein